MLGSFAVGNSILFDGELQADFDFLRFVALFRTNHYRTHNLSSALDGRTLFRGAAE